MLPAASDAQTGTYTVTYAGGTGYPSFIAPPPRYQNVTFTTAGNVYSGTASDSGGGDETAAVSCSPLTVTFT